MLDVTVIVATFGDYAAWGPLAHGRAIPSVEALGAPWVYVHAGSLHAARNAGLTAVDTEWVCHLDADDELEPGFFAAVEAGGGDVRVPSVRYVDVDGRSVEPRIPRVAGHVHDCEAGCLAEGNWIVVGAVARTETLRAVGGWRDFPVYEDYDLWARCHLAGASIERVPDAVYRAHVRPDSRNRGSLSPEAKHATHQDIARANGLLVPA